MPCLHRPASDAAACRTADQITLEVEGVVGRAAEGLLPGVDVEQSGKLKPRVTPTDVGAQPHLPVGLDKCAKGDGRGGPERGIGARLPKECREARSRILRRKGRSPVSCRWRNTSIRSSDSRPRNSGRDNQSRSALAAHTGQPSPSPHCRVVQGVRKHRESTHSPGSRAAYSASRR
jgi:hypothetical protein